MRVELLVSGVRGRDQAEALRDADRLAPARGAKLPVDGDRLGLDRVSRDVEPLADLLEGQMSGEQRKEPQLCAREPRARAVLRPWHRGDLPLEPVDTLTEVAESGADYEDSACLLEHHLRGL